MVLAGLLLVGVLATSAIRGTRGWLPFLGQTFQPVDVARVALLLFLYVGAEVGFGGWLSAYAVESDLANVTTAAYR